MKRVNNIIWAIVGVVICCVVSLALVYRNEIMSVLAQQSMVNALSSIGVVLMSIVIIIISLEMSIRRNMGSDERVQLIRNKASFETLKYFLLCLMCTPGFVSFLGLQTAHLNLSLLCLLAAVLIGIIYLMFFSYYYLKMT